MALYREHCKICHGVGGVPSKLIARRFPKIPDLSDSTFLGKRSDDSIVVVLQRGIGRDMKPFADKLSLDEMRAVVAYVRTLVRTH
jgi:mono/diheme cytochrome c family protein